MPPTQPLEVKVIYSAASRGRARTFRPAGPRLRARRRWPLTVGALSLLLAGLAYYGLWWHVDSWLYRKLMLHTPLPIDTTALDDMFEQRAQRGMRPPANGSQRSDGAESSGPSAGQASLRTGRPIYFVSTVYGWETVATVALCTLAVCGGTMVTSGIGAAARWFGLVASLAVLACLIWGIVTVWGERQFAYRPSELRLGIGGLVLLCATLGFTWGGGHRKLIRFCGFLIILAAAATVAGLFVGVQYEAVTPDEFPMSFWPFAMTAFVVQSLWGWLLLVVSGRLVR